MENWVGRRIELSAADDHVLDAYNADHGVSRRRHRREFAHSSCSASMWLDGGGVGRRSLPFEFEVPVPRIAAPGPAHRDLVDARGTRTTYSSKFSVQQINSALDETRGFGGICN